MNQLMSFEEFKEDWKLKHPASIPVEEIEESPYPNWLKPATFIMFLAVSLLSAVHTIPIVYAHIPTNSIVSEDTRVIAANASIIAFELGILLSAFLMITRSSAILAYVLLSTMFAGTLVANIQSISETSGNSLGEVIVTLMFGAGVPLIALAAGKTFVNIYNTERTLKKRAKDNFRDDSKNLDTVIIRDYTKYEKSWKANTEVTPVRRLSAQTNTDRQPKHIALEYLEAHTQETFTVRKLAEEAGVTNDAAHKAMKMFAANGHSQNGHSALQ